MSYKRYYFKDKMLIYNHVNIATVYLKKITLITHIEIDFSPAYVQETSFSKFLKETIKYNIKQFDTRFNTYYSHSYIFSHTYNIPLSDSSIVN